jgi:hypothetical protein
MPASASSGLVPFSGLFREFCGGLGEDNIPLDHDEDYIMMRSRTRNDHAAVACG